MWVRVIAAVACLLAGAAAAETPPPGAEGCGGCHGPPGRASSMPPLAGRPADEIVTAMRAFRDGSRPAVLMDRIARGYGEAETAAIAAWIAGGGR
ncbi:MAG: c-type cytochrome [Rhodospirillales bacterium]|jgi:sulfide dehydrogenase cytochrome subunit